MKKYYLAFVIPLLINILLGNTITVYGNIVDSKTLKPIANVNVITDKGGTNSNSSGEFDFTNSAALLAAAFPKTTRSVNEFEPSLLAPWTDTHAASPMAINPGTVLSLPLDVKTSAL